MNRQIKRRLLLSLALLLAFLAWTAVVCTVDVRPIGPEGSSVGLAAINQWVHTQTGVHLTLYTVTDWLGLVPVAVCVGFGLLGLCQWIRRKSLLKVDRSLFILGGSYLLTIALYLLFESVPINARPVILNGCLETSYPSSTTLLTLCVMPTAMRQFCARLRRRPLRLTVLTACAVFTAFMVIGRFLSGVHWMSDIVGGILLSTSLITAVAALDAPCDLR